MNLYLRYFDKEALVHNVEDAIDFLSSIPEIEMDDDLADDIRDYAESDMYYPKRYKVRPRVYFIIIKTEAETMLEEREGWYEGALDFKRVVLIPSTGKHEYRDTHFVAQCKAVSGMECYSRIVDYLRTRVDGRSQFPSAKGKNFKFKFLGYCK